jgi:cell division protein FtsW
MSGMIFVYMGMGLLGYLMATECRHKEPFYLLSILVFLLCFQAFFNLAVVSGLLPSKGMNLPFFSQGGSSLLAQLFTVGIILSIHKESIAFHENTI